MKNKLLMKENKTPLEIQRKKDLINCFKSKFKIRSLEFRKISADNRYNSTNDWYSLRRKSKFISEELEEKERLKKVFSSPEQLASRIAKKEPSNKLEKFVEVVKEMDSGYDIIYPHLSPLVSLKGDEGVVLCKMDVNPNPIEKFSTGKNTYVNHEVLSSIIVFNGYHSLKISLENRILPFSFNFNFLSDHNHQEQVENYLKSYKIERHRSAIKNNKLFIEYLREGHKNFSGTFVPICYLETSIFQKIVDLKKDKTEFSTIRDNFGLPNPFLSSDGKYHNVGKNFIKMWNG